VAVFVRSSAELDRAKAAAKHAELPAKVLDDNVETAIGRISIGTMHLAKGLEFRAVAVMACDDEIIPLQERRGLSRFAEKRDPLACRMHDFKGHQSATSSFRPS
jgi:superfamily I DNA/RNA helicase